MAAEAIEWLQNETVIRIGREFRSVGGPDAVTPGMLTECYEQMAAWVYLAREAIQIEWPSFEAIRAFSVFQLKPRLTSAVVKNDLSKICAIFDEKSTLPALVRSYGDCQYTAAKKSILDLVVLDVIVCNSQ